MHGTPELMLLTHEREMTRKSNTGACVINVLGDNVRRIIWQRKAPDADLIKLIQTEAVALLWPGEASQVFQSEQTLNYKSIILIDATWQESQKIFNRSPYLHGLPSLKLISNRKSVYRLRRNQVAHGLCTAEAVMEIYAGNSDICSEISKQLQQLQQAR